MVRYNMIKINYGDNSYVSTQMVLVPCGFKALQSLFL